MEMLEYFLRLTGHVSNLPRTVFYIRYITHCRVSFRKDKLGLSILLAHADTHWRMIGDGLIFLIALLDTGFLLFIAIYYIVTISDLECDYLNAASCCSRLNSMVLPEIISLSVTSLLLLFGLHWFLFILNIPMLAYLAYRYYHVPSGNIGMYDPTEIHNRRLIQFHMKESMIKTGNHVLFFFVYIYCLIFSLLSSSNTE